MKKGFTLIELIVLILIILILSFVVITSVRSAKENLKKIKEMTPEEYCQSVYGDYTLSSVTRVPMRCWETLKISQDLIDKIK